MFWKKKKSQPPKEIKTEEKGGKKNYFLKIILMGDGAVGKTNLRRRYLGQGFSKDHLMTIGADFAAADRELVVGDTTFNITYQIWDLAGQSSFNQVREMYYKGAFGSLVLFDITRPTSFKNLDVWIKELSKHSGRGQVPMVILGNKYDLVDSAETTVNDMKVKAYLEKLNEDADEKGFTINYLHTSALTGLNVDKAFDTLGKSILKWLGVADN